MSELRGGRSSRRSARAAAWAVCARASPARRRTIRASASWPSPSSARASAPPCDRCPAPSCACVAPYPSFSKRTFMRCRRAAGSEPAASSPAPRRRRRRAPGRRWASTPAAARPSWSRRQRRDRRGVGGRAAGRRRSCGRRERFCGGGVTATVGDRSSARPLAPDTPAITAAAATTPSRRHFVLAAATRRSRRRSPTPVENVVSRTSGRVWVAAAWARASSRDRATTRDTGNWLPPDAFSAPCSSAMSAKRSSGFLASIFSTSASSASGISGRVDARRRGRHVEVHVDQLAEPLRNERRLPGQHLVEDHAQRVDVAAVIDRLASRGTARATCRSASPSASRCGS